LGKERAKKFKPTGMSQTKKGVRRSRVIALSFFAVVLGGSQFLKCSENPRYRRKDRPEGNGNAYLRFKRGGEWGRLRSVGKSQTKGRKRREKEVQSAPAIREDLKAATFPSAVKRP